MWFFDRKSTIKTENFGVDIIMNRITVPRYTNTDDVLTLQGF